MTDKSDNAMKEIKNKNSRPNPLRSFYLLWSTQALSQLGSSVTSFALTLWLFQKTGSALQTALLTVCSYLPYVLLSVFAGAVSDRWDKKKVLLVSDSLAALSTILVLILLRADLLEAWMLYGLNALNGLMNAVQSPVSEVVITLLTPRDQFQKVSGLRSLSNSLISFFHPLLASVLFGFGGMGVVIGFDLSTFILAFLTLAFRIRIPGMEKDRKEARKESVSDQVRQGFSFLKSHPIVLNLILFLASVNLVASSFDAALPAYILSVPQGGQTIYGWICSAGGLAMIAGALTASMMPPVRNRIRMIVFSMVLSLTLDNFLISTVRIPILWVMAQFLGYYPVPLMNTSLDVEVRSSVPVSMQTRVYAIRNCLQFFTIPLGLLGGGFLVDAVFEPLMEHPADFLSFLFGTGKGSGAAFFIFLLGFLGLGFCLYFGRKLFGLQKREGKRNGPKTEPNIG